MLDLKVISSLSYMVISSLSVSFIFPTVFFFSLPLARQASVLTKMPFLYVSIRHTIDLEVISDYMYRLPITLA